VFTGVLNIENDRHKIIDISKMQETLGVKALSGNNGSQNKSIGANGGDTSSYSEISEENLYDEFSGILSFN
jgi:hypothetical protein